MGVNTSFSFSHTFSNRSGELPLLTQVKDHHDRHRRDAAKDGGNVDGMRLEFARIAGKRWIKNEQLISENILLSREDTK